jgi:hypothetical protein
MIANIFIKRNHQFSYYKKHLLLVLDKFINLT